MSKEDIISSNSSVEDLTYEQAFAEIEQITVILETGEHTLDQVISLFERGQALLKRCIILLDQAELKVQQIQGDELSEFSLDEF